MIIYTGTTCYLGEWHFTSGKIYKTYHYSKKVFYIISDNNMNYHFNIDEDMMNNFLILDKWREIQINKILNKESKD